MGSFSFYTKLSYHGGLHHACVELLFADSNIISIDCIVVENEVADNRFDRAELDWLIYNKPLEYADIVLNGGIEEYCKSSCEHSIIEN